MLKPVILARIWIDERHGEKTRSVKVECHEEGDEGNRTKGLRFPVPSPDLLDYRRFRLYIFNYTGRFLCCEAADTAASEWEANAKWVRHLSSVSEPFQHGDDLRSGAASDEAGT